MSASAVPAARFVDTLLDAGFDYFTGVPCSLVASVIAELERRGLYDGDLREDAALGVAAGAYLGGRTPVVIMQNSGLGVSLNALGSLQLSYHLPCLLLITWRGYAGKDAPEHLVMGDVMRRLLDLFSIPHRAPTAETLAADVAWAKAHLARTGMPAAILVKPGLCDDHS